MATIAKQNPKFAKGEAIDIIRVPSAAATWKAGQFLKVAAGLATPCVSDDQIIKYIALSDQDSAPTAGTLVKVGVLKAGTILEINELDGTLSTANVNENYAIDVTSNIVTVDVGDTTNTAVKIVQLASDYNSEKYDSSDVQARCRIQILQSVLDA